MNSEFRHRTSLVLNVVLAVTAGVLAFRGSRPEPVAPASGVAPARTTNEKLFTVVSRYPGAASAQDQRRWLVDQLRAMGVPNKILAQVVWADLDWKWNQQGGELSLKCHGNSDTMEAFSLQNEMSLDGEMRAALGEEGFKQWDHENMMREANSGKVQLTSSETDAAYDLWKKVQQRDLELRQARLKGEMDDSDINKAQEKSVSEFTEEMKALLGDERYAKSQQKDDGSAAENLRQDFAKANPSDTQFQELLKTQQQWNEQRAALDKQFQDDSSSSAYADQIKALEEARDQEYRRVLGADVFDTLQKSQDPNYAKMKKCEAIWGLDDNKIDSVYAALKYYEKSVQDYQARARALEAQGQSVDWDAVNQNLQLFAQQSEQVVREYLSGEQFNKLKNNQILSFAPTDN